MAVLSFPRTSAISLPFLDDGLCSQVQYQLKLVGWIPLRVGGFGLYTSLNFKLAPQVPILPSRHPFGP